MAIPRYCLEAIGIRLPRNGSHGDIQALLYGQRWQVETTFSMIKRRLGSAVNARTYWSQCRALMFKAVTHNVLILYAPSEPSRQAA